MAWESDCHTGKTHVTHPANLIDHVTSFHNQKCFPESWKMRARVFGSTVFLRWGMLSAFDG